MITQRHSNDYSLVTFRTSDIWIEEEIYRDYVKTRSYVCYTYVAPDIQPGYWELLRTYRKYYRR